MTISRSMLAIFLFTIPLISLVGTDGPRVRTPFLPDLGQVPLEDLQRQAKAYPEHYVLQGPETKKVIALTFDDGPSEYTKQLLKVLDRHAVRASFFWMGSKVMKYPQLVKDAQRAGHILANHSWSHPYLNGLKGGTWWNEEIERTQKTYEKLLGLKPAFMRPPYGFLNDDQVEEIGARSMTAVLWSVASDDWYISDRADELAAAQSIAAQIVTYAHPGAIVLMHDAGGSTRLPTVRATEMAIVALRMLGYEFVTIDSLLLKAPYLD